MDIEPDPVAEPMPETVAVAGICDDLARCAVHRLPGHTGARHLNACELGIQHGLVDPAHLVGHTADRDGAGHVRAVAGPFESDEERLEHLFNLYERMIAAEGR